MSRNTRTGLLAGLLVFAMTGLAFASVPLYRLFCQVTGFDGTTMRSEAAPGPVAGKEISVRFDANSAPSLPWQFKPEKPHETVTIGEREIAFYTARNLAAVPVKGTATFNVSPAKAGKYFSKIQCFCFTEQQLEAGEQVRMPVVFYVDPAILKDEEARKISEITLSYTFYPVDSAGKRS